MPENLFSNSIILEDNSQFYYTVKPYELTNTLGSVVAVLKEYSFTKKDDNSSLLFCKLYNTQEDNWYDISDDNADIEKSLLLSLKTAINRLDNPAVLSK